jgi:hypothetical protein
MNGIVLVITIVINYLSNTGIFNGKTMAKVSAEYQNLFTPAGYAFSIWGLIYLGLSLFVIYYGRSVFILNIDDDQTILEIGWWFVISCLANSLWIMAWLYKYILLTILLMVLLFVSLLKIVVNTKIGMANAPLKKLIFLWWPFSIYSGWISVALIANVAAYLTKIEWNRFGISETTWTIVIFIIAGSVHIFMIWKRNMSIFALAAVWALLAIAVTNQHQNNKVFLGAIVTAIIIFINICVYVFKNRKSDFPIYK